MKRAALILCASIGIAFTLGGGAPRLIGYGCSNPPSFGPLTYTGPRLAREESDFPQCARIEPLTLENDK